MQILYCCILIFIWGITQSIFAQQIDKVIISGYGGQHDLDVKTAFLIGYASYNNTPFTGEVILYSNTLQLSFDYAVANDYDLIIRSTSGLSTGLRLAPDYPTVELVMPAGSNTFTQVFFGDVITSPVVITGAGVDSNLTGYKLEFYGIDPVTELNYSSFSNGYIAGQLAFISNTLNVSFDSARALARVKGSENGVLDFYNGFGEIQPQNIIIDPLPVELTSFNAKVIGKNILLIWQTATEINNYGFEVERMSNVKCQKSEQWTKLGFVDGNGNSNSPKDYLFEDKNPAGSGEIKYRLKQIDNNGQFKYSDMVGVYYSLNDFQLFQNYPNPFNNSTTISWQQPTSEFISLKVYDVLGNEVTTLLNENMEGGKHIINFDASNLSSGIYIYKLQSIDFTQNKKITLLK